MPLLAVAEEILALESKVELLYLGRREDIADFWSRQTDIVARAIYAGKLRRYFSWLNFLDLLIRLPIGFFQSLAAIKSFKPMIIFAKGGYVSVPVILAAKVLKIPIIAHESDVVLGLANRLAARWAKIVACGFEPRFYLDLSPKNMVFVGNPVRKDFLIQAKKPSAKILAIGKKKIERGKRPVLLITGSSQGAHRINELILAILPALLESLTVVHISGRGDYLWLENESARLTEKQKPHYFLYSFLTEEMPAAAAFADLVISRASAGLLSELAILAKPTIVIPLSTAASNHQWHNAKIFEREAAIRLVDERTATPADLKKAILEIINNSKKLKELSENIAKFSHPEAAKELAKLIIKEAKTSFNDFL